MKFINKLQNFMYGRYGVDDLYKFLVFVYFILAIINLFIHNQIIAYVELIIMFIIFYRVLSKNIYARNNENRVFLKIKNKIFKPFTNVKRNVKDKNHVYKKCRCCKTILKLPLPNERGFRHVKCPTCKHRNKYLILKKQKIEIIKSR